MQKQSRSHFFILLILYLPMMTACVDVMAVSVALKPIIHHLHITLHGAQWLMSAYFLGIASFLIVSGWLADIYGPRKILLYGVAIFAGSSAIAWLASSLFFLVAARFLQGIGCGIMMTVTVAVIARLVSESRRNQAIAWWGVSLGFGLTLGPVIGGVLLTVASWRMIFFVNIPLCLASFFAILYYVPKMPKSVAGAKINWFRALLLIITIVLPVYLITELMFFDQLNHWVFLFGLVFVGFLIFGRRYYFRDGIDLSLFKSKQYIIGVMSGAISYYCSYAWLFYMNIYLQAGLSFSSLSSGVVMMAYSISFALNSILLTRLLGRLDRVRLMQAGFFIMFLSFVIMLFIHLHVSLFVLLASFFMLGIGMTTINTPSVSLAVSSVPVERSGTASGVMFTIRWLSGALGVICVTFIFHLYSFDLANLSVGATGGQAVSFFQDSLHHAFFIATLSLALVALLGGLATFFVKKTDF